MAPQKSGYNKFKFAEPHSQPKIPRRIIFLSLPKKGYESEEGLPSYTKSGVRVSALRGHLHNSDIALPLLRRLLSFRRIYRNKLSQDRLQRVDQYIRASNNTVYAKLAGVAIDFKEKEAKDAKKKKPWSESEWKKHMEYISQVAAPKKDFEAPPPPRGKTKPLEAFMPRLKLMSSRPDNKCYKTLSQEAWYRNPVKVSPKALKYKITERILKLAVAKVTAPD